MLGLIDRFAVESSKDQGEIVHFLGKLGSWYTQSFERKMRNYTLDWVEKKQKGKDASLALRFLHSIRKSKKQAGHTPYWSLRSPICNPSGNSMQRLLHGHVQKEFHRCFALWRISLRLDYWAVCEWSKYIIGGTQHHSIGGVELEKWMMKSAKTAGST